MRHTTASIWISPSLNPVYVSRILGHRSVSLTLDIYGHLWAKQEHEDRAVDAMEAVLGRWRRPVTNLRAL